MRKKRLFSAILAAVMFLSLGCTSVSASELTEPSEHDIDVALVNRGYPQLVVDSMSLSAKKSIYDDTSLYFKSAAITTYEEDTHTFTNYNVPSDGVMPLGQLPLIQSQFLIFPLIQTLFGFSFPVCSANCSAEFEEKS